MTSVGWAQLAAYLVVLLLLVRPLGAYMARVYQGERTPLDRVLGPVENALYRIAGVRAGDEMGWREYAVAALVFNAAGILAVYAVQRLQHVLPLNPQGLPAVGPFPSFNTAVSFATNTNWQSYGGETTMSHLTQMVAMTVQNFVSAATGMAVLVAMARGFVRQNVQSIGNFWVDMTRSTLWILLPLSVALALVLVSQGVVQTMGPNPTATLVQATTGVDGAPAIEQQIAVGPAASQIAIKQLGTNGGGFFNANSAHPFENPTPLSFFLEALSILLIPAALTYTFGRMARDTRQGWAILAAMTVVFVVMLVWAGMAESAAGSALSRPDIDAAASAGTGVPGGNMEGKEVRFGVAGTALWATATTSASNGSVNGMHASFTPLGAVVPLALMGLGEVVFGGVGSGLYGMLAFVIVAVFVAGLLVGRTPEYLGKKVAAYEMKLAALIVLVPPVILLAGTAAATALPAGRSSVLNGGPRGFTEILYNVTSAANNNGSAFAGMNADTSFYHLLLAVAMLVGRYWPLVLALAIGGALAGKGKVPPSAGTLPTHGPLFVGWLIAVVVIVGALALLPAIALGPLAEHLAAGGI